MVRRVDTGQHRFRQPTRLSSEQKGITRLIAGKIVMNLSSGCECVKMRGADFFKAVFQLIVDLHFGKLRVIHACATQAGCIQREAQGLNKMKSRADIGTQTDDIPGIGRNLWLMEDDMEHGIFADTLQIAEDGASEIKRLIVKPNGTGDGYGAA